MVISFQYIKFSMQIKVPALALAINLYRLKIIVID